MGNPGLTGTSGPAGPQGPAGPTGFLYMMSLDNGTTIGPYFAAPNETVSMSSGNLNYDAGGFLNAVVVPGNCTVNYLKVGTYNYYDNGADTTTFTVLHNGSATTMSCVAATPSGGKATCNDTTHTFAVAAGDTLTIEIAQTNDTPYEMYSSALACQ